MIVLDSAALVDLLFQREPETSWVHDQLADAGRAVHAPQLIDAEVLAVIRDRVVRRYISAADGAERVRRVRQLAVVRYPHVDLLERAWELHPAVTASDALFIALAEALNIPLVTTDRRLARAHGPRIPVLAP